MQEKRNRAKRSEVAEQIENRDRTIEVQSEEIVGPDPNSITNDRLIPTGSTRVNLCCSDNRSGGFVMGSINTIPGKSGSGKTIFMLTMLAECAIDKRFDEYDLIYDDAEQALQGFNLEYLFSPLVDRMTAPIVKDGRPIHSNTIQDFKANVLLKCQSGKPFIYVLDSLDALSSSEELEREYAEALKHAKSPEEEKEIKGSYKAEKAKGIGEALRMINGSIKNSNSALFIIQQTRQKFNAPVFARQWVTAGGEAPFFYSFHCVYLCASTAHTDTARGIKNKIGGKTKVEIIKNKLTGKKRECEIDIYESYGIDDLSGCIDFLSKTNEIEKKGGWFTFKDQKFQMYDLLKYIENNNLEKEIRDMVYNVWMDIEDQMKLDRKRKYE